MNKNTLIAYTDSETTFIAMTKMEYDDHEKTDYTITVMTNPNYGDSYDDYTLTCKDFYKAWSTFKTEIVKHDIGGIYFDDFDSTGSVAIAWKNGIFMDLRSAYECGWSLETETAFYDMRSGEPKDYHYEEYSHITDAISALKKKAEEYGITNIIIDPYYKDENKLMEIDKRHDDFQRQEMYRDACNLEWYCNDSSLMRRYEQTYCEEE